MIKTINVTQENIDNGMSCSSTACPIALACKEVGLVDPYVDVGAIYSAQISILPQVAIDFITLFDKNMPVAPFSFDINI